RPARTDPRSRVGGPVRGERHRDECPGRAGLRPRRQTAGITGARRSRLPAQPRRTRRARAPTDRDRRGHRRTIPEVTMAQILVLNGPNLNLLGEREPEIYGRTTPAHVESMCAGAPTAQRARRPPPTLPAVPPAHTLALTGPNPNPLGQREPEIYGRTTLADIESMCADAAAEAGLTTRCVQSNHEGGLIDAVHEARN